MSGGSERKHQNSEEENIYYEYLAQSLRLARKSAGYTQMEMAELTGYSVQQIRRFEQKKPSDGKEKSPIPSYVVAKYARECEMDPGELIRRWTDESNVSNPYYLRAEQSQKEKLKLLRKEEKELVAYLRNSVQSVAEEIPAVLLRNFSREDYELLYCLHRIREENGKADTLIRSLIYDMYMRCTQDHPGVKETITEDLREDITVRIEGLEDTEMPDD